MLIIITNSIKPYCCDIEPIIGLPKNLSHRFRYQSKWIHLSYPIKEMKGKYGIIVLRNRESADLTIIRNVTIDNIFSYGDINYLELQLGDFLPEGRESELLPLINSRIAELGISNSPNKSLQYLIFEVSVFEGPHQIDTEDSGKWASLTSHLGRMNCFKDYCFLKILSIVDSEGQACQIIHGAAGKYYYNLKRNTLYYLNVIHNIASIVDEKESIKRSFLIRLSSESDEIGVLRKSQRVVGKYDLLRFIFKTPPCDKDKYSYLELEKVFPDEESIIENISLLLPIKISISKIRRLLYICRYPALFFSIIGIFWGQTISNLLKCDVSLTRTISILLLILATNKWDDFFGAIAKDTKTILNTK